MRNLYAKLGFIYKCPQFRICTLVNAQSDKVPKEVATVGELVKPHFIGSGCQTLGIRRHQGMPESPFGTKTLLDMHRQY